MKKVLIIGANSRIARFAEAMLVKMADVQLTLFLRHPERLAVELPAVQVIQGDATNPGDVAKAVSGMDIVYASLAGDVIGAAKTIVKAMDDVGVKRLIWTSSLGIYNEIPGEFGRWNQQIMGDYYHRYRLAADVVENSDLDYTIIRPAWLTNEDEVDYETTRRDDPFKGTEVSRKSVAAFVVKLIADPTIAVRDSIGVDKPGTAADRPRPAVMAANGGYEPDVKEDIKLRFK
ncbi:SDR family oxidoreductase [Limosilactobacillus sp.]|uniref:SDR family oxidoreductase n=1 Tax=Limosilactobacillus sp. TaxID=2773925 RepID=UPI003EFDACE7